jgi:hypothetical protein
VTRSFDNATLTALDRDRAVSAKRAFTTRRVPLDDMWCLIAGDVRPLAGDLVLATVEEIGFQGRLESPEGRRVHLFPGDEIIVCYGNRYAPDQFEAVIGDDLGACNLVAVGGIASNELSRHGRMPASTRIAPIGLIGDVAGNRLNLRDYAIRPTAGAGPIATVVVAGTSMNAGKTLSAASIVHSLKTAGHRVAAIKATGTGAGGDLWIMRDVAADIVVDFTDAGFVSTYKVAPEDIERATADLIGHAADAGCEFAVIEVADGLHQAESAALLRSQSLRADCLGVVFAAYDALGAKAGIESLARIGHRVLAVSGKLTRSPLAASEAEQLTGLPVFTPQTLRDGALLRDIIAATEGKTRDASLPNTAGAERAANHAPVHRIAPTDPPHAMVVESGVPA